MPRALWAKAPFVLLRHPAVLVAVISASCLLALAAASAPLLRAGAESEALKGKLAQLTPLGAGLTILTRAPSEQDPERTDRARRAAAQRLARATPFVTAPVLTTMAYADVGGKALEGGIPLSIVPMARTNATAHVHRLSGGGAGAWIAGSISKLARIGPGGTLELIPSGFRDRQATPVHVAAVYRQLDDDLDNPYWVNFATMIRTRNPDSPPLPTFLFLSQAELYRVAAAVGSGLTNVYELPVAAQSMTPARAKGMAVRFAEIRRRLSRPSPLARGLGCELGCSVTSPIEAAVVLAAQSADALTAVISLLAGFALVIAIGAAFVAGAFNVRRRSEEARLSVVGGESRWAFAARAAVEATCPVLVGAGAGVALALILVRVLTPDGTVERTVVVSALLAGAADAGASIVAVALGAGLARGPTIERAHRRWRLLAIPWELPLLVAAAAIFVVVERGGGLVKNTTTGSHPRLVVLLFPLLVAAAAAGLAVRVLRRALRAISPATMVVFLAIRRLAAARALLVLLTVTATVSFAALTFAEVLRESLTSNSAEKAYIANGGDVQGVIDPGATIPPSLPFATAKVDQSFGTARLDADGGPPAELLAVDPKALIRVIRWHWSGDPARALRELASSKAALPAVAVGGRAADTRAAGLLELTAGANGSGTTFVLATHDRDVLSIADHVVELERGRNAASSPVPSPPESRPREQVVLRAGPLSRTYGETRALAAASIELRAGELSVVVGRSGSGKSTLLMLLGGWERPDDGAGAATDLSWSHLAYVPQRFGLVPELTIRENIDLPARLAQTEGATDELLERLDLGQLARRFPAEISVGQQQRAALARGLCLRPAILLVDEPTSHQDAASAERVWESISAAAAAGTGCLVATHEPDARHRAHTSWEIEGGRLTRS